YHRGRVVGGPIVRKWRQEGRQGRRRGRISTSRSIHREVIVEIRLVDVRQQADPPRRPHPRLVAGADREGAVRELVIVQRKADLLQIVLARGPPRRLPGLLDGREQQGNENRDDRYHHEEFDKRESSRRTAAVRW